MSSLKTVLAQHCLREGPLPLVSMKVQMKGPQVMSTCEKIRSVKDFEKIINGVLQSSEKTMLIAIYNNQNQRRYIGVKLD